MDSTGTLEFLCVSLKVNFIKKRQRKANKGATQKQKNKHFDKIVYYIEIHRKYTKYIL